MKETTSKSERVKTSLKEEFRSAIMAALTFKPECGTEYTTNVYNRLLVKDCDDITAAEITQMAQDLVSKAQSSADTICALNPDCPNARLVDFTITRFECDRRLWEVDVKFVFVCEK